MARKRHASEYVQLNVRMKETMRREIEKSANRHGLTMNAEVLQRIERHGDRFGGERLVELVETIARAMKSAGEMAGFLEAHQPVNDGRWLALPFAYDQAARAAMAVIEAHRPPGEIVVPEWKVAEVVGDADPQQVKALSADLGEMFTAKILREREDK